MNEEATFVVSPLLRALEFGQGRNDVGFPLVCHRECLLWALLMSVWSVAAFMNAFEGPDELEKDIRGQ